MKKEKISDKQAISMIILFISGSTIVMGSAKESKADLWIAIIIGIVMAIIITHIYASILSAYPGKNLYEINELILGRWIGKLINIFYIWYAFYLAALVLINFGEFIKIVGLESTPMLVVISSFMFLVIWGTKLGIEVLGRWAQLFVVILFLIVLLVAPLLIPNIETNNLKPILAEGFKPILSDSFSSFSFPFAETVVFAGVFDALKIKESNDKVYLRGTLIGGGLLLGTAIMELLTLGEYKYKASYFPAYAAVSRINISNVIQRVEILVAVTLLIGGFIKISICLLSCCKGIQKVFNLKDYRFFVTPVGILVIIISITTYDSIMEMFEWATKDYNYYAFPFQTIFPILILGVYHIKKMLLPLKSLE